MEREIFGHEQVTRMDLAQIPLVNMIDLSNLGSIRSNEANHTLGMECPGISRLSDVAGLVGLCVLRDTLAGDSVDEELLGGVCARSDAGIVILWSNQGI